MIKLASAIVIKGENSVPVIGKVVAGDPLAGVTLMVDGRERVRAVVAADLPQDPDGACARPVADQVIELASGPCQDNRMAREGGKSRLTG